MAYNSISIKPYIKSHLELQREITLKNWPLALTFLSSICLAYMNMFARFDENPAMTLHDIKETKRYGRTHTRTENVKTVYPPQTKFGGGGGGSPYKTLWSSLTWVYTVCIHLKYMSHNMRFPTMWYVRPAKAQTSLRIRTI